MSNLAEILELADQMRTLFAGVRIPPQAERVAYEATLIRSLKDGGLRPADAVHVARRMATAQVLFADGVKQMLAGADALTAAAEECAGLILEGRDDNAGGA